MSEIDKNNNNSADAEIWFQNRHAEKHEFEKPTFVDLTEPDEPEESEKLTSRDVKDQQIKIEYNKPVATTIVEVMDILIPSLFIIILKIDNNDGLKLDASEKEALLNAWANYLESKNIELSPGTMLIITILSIYGPKVTVIMNERKQQEKIKALNKRVYELEKELDKKNSENQGPEEEN